MGKRGQAGIALGWSSMSRNRGWLWDRTARAEVQSTECTGQQSQRGCRHSTLPPLQPVTPTGSRDPPHCPHCPPQHCPQANSKWPGPVLASLRDVSTETHAAAFQCPLARASGAPGQWCKRTTLQGGWGAGCAGDAVDQLSPLLWGACFTLRKASPPSSTLSKAGVWEKQSGSRYPRASRPQESSWPA